MLENDICVDDIINSQDAQQDCMVVAEEIFKIIARESMSVKVFTFTGTTSQTRKCPLIGHMSDWPATYNLLKPTTRSVDQSSHGCVKLTISIMGFFFQSKGSSIAGCYQGRKHRTRSCRKGIQHHVSFHPIFYTPATNANDKFSGRYLDQS